MPGLRTKILPVILVLVGIVAMLTAACGGGQETNPEKLVPDGANLIAQVNLTGMLASNGLLSLVSTVTADQENPMSIDDLLNEALSETGVDLRQFSQAALFMDTGRSSGFTGVIAKGNFNELSLISSIRNALDAPLVSTPYKDHLLYVAENDFSFSVLEEGILVLGTGEAIRAVIDVQRGDRDRVSGDLVEAFKDLGGGFLRLEAAVPTDLATQYLPFFLATFPFLGDALSGEGASGLFGAVDGLQDLEFAGLTLAQNGQIFIMRINLEFSNQESAEAIKGLLAGLITLVKSLSPAPEITALLEKLEVVRDDAQVSIRLEIDGPELANLISGLTTITQSEGGRIQEPLISAAPIVALGDAFPIMPTSFHVPLGQGVDYSTTPPTSGDHWERWADCGFYPEGLPDEIITHNLEHGNIVVSYNLPLQGQIDRLRAVIDNIALPAAWGVTRYYDEIPEGQVVLSAWGRMVRLAGVDPANMEAFFSTYVGQLGPERIPC